MTSGRFVEPLGLLTGPVAFHALRDGYALPLQGGDIAFAFVRLIQDGEDLGVGPVRDVPEDWQEALQAIAQRPLPFAGLTSDRPLLMGVLNVTPDSFSGDGAPDPGRAIAAGHAMLEAGADILDIGGESTRPGAAGISADEEMARILPVLRSLAKDAPVSVDTRHAATMRAALDAGAEIINDVSALRHDPESLALTAASKVPVILMHMPGDDPSTMQSLAGCYDDVAMEVAGFLRERIATCEAMGIPRGRIAVDPGIGFGKTMAHNLALIDRLPLLASLGCRVVLGASRKRFIGTLSGVEKAALRVSGSLAAALAGAARGASILRVHDVAQTAEALAVWRACAAGRAPEDIPN